MGQHTAWWHVENSHWLKAQLGWQHWDPLEHATVMLGTGLQATSIECEGHRAAGILGGCMESRTQEGKLMELRSIKDS